jgi:hypothetical protein
LSGKGGSEKGIVPFTPVNEPPKNNNWFSLSNAIDIIEPPVTLIFLILELIVDFELAIEEKGK